MNCTTLFLMTNTLKKIPTLLAAGEVATAIEQLQSALSLSDSELVNDMVLISATYQKFCSDQRRGILDYNQENLTYNRIVNHILTLAEELENDPSILKGFQQLEDDFEMAMRRRLEECLKTVTKTKHKIILDPHATEILFNRMSKVKNRHLNFNLLWIDDHPHTIGNEVMLLEAIGANIDHAADTETALTQMATGNYSVILSDLVRQGDHAEGVRLLPILQEQSTDLPIIFYSQNIDWSRGTPPYAFGLAALPSDLLHLVMDVLDRTF